MKKYEELKVEILVLTEKDVITASGFTASEKHFFGGFVPTFEE